MSYSVGKTKKNGVNVKQIFLLQIIILGLIFLISAYASALTITPNAWNVIGLDSNSPASGPNRFPVGAKICGGTPGANETVTFNWDTGGTDNGTYIYLRPGSLSTINVTYGADGCADAYFEVEVARNASAYGKTRRYYITAGSVSTPRPRELYVEYLISQSRNYITDVKLNGVSIPAGGSMNLFVGNTYTIQLYGGTAPQGYNQFEEFINFPNTIFQILSVSTDYSANNSPYVSTTGHKYIYADACQWENDPNSPNYLSCLYDYKAGGSNVVTTYVVKIISGGGTSEVLNTLLYDFSGSSFHYNADFSTSARVANIYGPSSITITKAFEPKTIMPNDTSTLTFTITNPTSEAISEVNFTDSFPFGLTVASTPNVIYNGCGGGAFSPALSGGETSLSFSGGAINANSSCTISLSVTATTEGTYNNTTGYLYINNTTNTNNNASDSLIVSTQPPPPSSCGTPQTLATWTMPTSGQGSGGPPPPYTTKASDVSTATASSAGGTFIISTAQGNPVNSWAGNGWAASGSETPPGASTLPYYEFVIDTSKYGGVQISFQYYLNQGDWASVGNNYIYVYSKADNGNFNSGTAYSATKGSWQTITYTAPVTGSSTTTFRISAAGARDTSKYMYLDNITFSGCQRPNPPNISKVFSPSSIAVNASSTLSFTISNPNPTASLSGISFTDVLPQGLSIANSSSSQCGGTLTTNAGTRTITFSGGSLSGGANCSFSVTVTGTTAGQYQNVSGNISATESGPNTGGPNTGYAVASLTVIAPPAFSKSFSPTSIFTGNTSTLTFTITNPNTANGLANISFTDTLPAGLTVTSSTSSQCGGTLTTTAPDTISFAGGTLSAGASCSFAVTVTGATAGTKNNSTGNITATSGTVNLTGASASASIIVNDQNSSIDLVKQISTSPSGPWYKYVAVASGGNVYYRFKVDNTGDTPLYNVGITETAGSINPMCSWPNPLPVGGTAYCTAGPFTATTGSYTNTAYAHAQYPDGGTVYNSTNSSATYATTDLSISKNATESSFKVVGDVLHYSYTVTNSGYATLNGPVSVFDDKTSDENCPSLITIGDLDNYFDPGESITCTSSYTVTTSDIMAKQVTNTAYATAGGATSPTTNKTVSLATADLIALKTNNTNNQVIAGNSFEWVITASNTANQGSAPFTDGQKILTDVLPDVDVTYVLGTVKKSGITGNINCSLATNTINCVASGNVIIPPTLQGTVSVTNGSNVITGTGTAFTTQLSVGSIILINNVPYTVSAITNDTSLTLTTNYAGATASGVSIPASFSIPVTVTVAPSANGSLTNPKSGGVCKVDPDTLIAETNENNNDCTNSVTVIALPNLTVVKSVQAYSDPINGTTNPKIIPGSEIIYTIVVTNSGGGAVDSDSIVLTDPIPTNMVLCVSNTCSNPPVTFSCSSTPPCGLTFNYASDVTYYDAGGNPYTPVPDSAGYDANVRNISINPKGVLNGSSGAPHPNFTITFKGKVQ
jgi:uncharacterized repeat protein (TIGR01451 family)